MARNTLLYTVPDAGRDFGKAFLLTEMPASKSESWAMRALLALMASGVEVPEGVENMGMAAMAELGLKALSGLKWEVAEPLLAEMWDCIQIIPDPAKPHIVRKVFDEDIEELMTRVKLRGQVWKLHTGFLKDADPLTSEAAAAASSANNSPNM